MCRAYVLFGWTSADFFGQRKCEAASYRATNQWSIPRKV